MASLDSVPRQLRPLLDYLAHVQLSTSATWQGWHITPIAGGANNRVYRGSGPGGNVAIKFTIRDQRRRAEREYAALRALEQHALAIAPRPVALDTSSAQPVVVQTWLDGELLRAPPGTDDDWSHLVQHLATIHTVTPANTGITLASAVLAADSAVSCRRLVHEQLALLPPAAQPAELVALVQRLDRRRHRRWPPPPVALCRVDPNTSNFIRRAGPWASVDWENSGWGDPAFEIADLITHPAYLEVAPARWDWVVERYCRLARDTNTALRIGVYRRTLLVWWVARLARVLYDVPRGEDRRLVAWPADWEAETKRKYQHYLERAQAYA